jgi:methylglutaconyl-CoA hydratase
LIGLLGAIAGCPLPVVAAVHGAAYGGGLGLVCAADLAIAASGTQFSLSETRLGLVPAVIGPYVVAALGPREARARMMLAAPFGVEDALRIGLIHRTTTADGLATAVDETIADLLQSPPGALAAAKGLVRTVVNRTPDETRDQMGALLAERRASDEGQEGMAAFLEKRRPSWVPPQSDTP